MQSRESAWTCKATIASSFSWWANVIALTLTGCVAALCVTSIAFLRLSPHAPPGSLVANTSSLPELEARLVRTCDSTAPPARYSSDSITADALHVAFLMTNSANPARVRTAVQDILAHTGATVDVVVHLISDVMDDSFPSALPSCDGLSVNLLDAARMKDASVARLCSVFGLEVHEHPCYFLLKPLLYQWMPPEVGAVLVLDSDVRVIGDVRELLVAELAALRAAGTPLGVAAEMQPQYAPIIGDAGFNGGVQLQDLQALRALAPAFEEFLGGLDSSAGISLFGREEARMGDQSLFTLLSTTELGRTGGAGGAPFLRLLPCTWNVQLCLYHSNENEQNRARFPGLHVSACKGAPRLIHGNGGTYSDYVLDRWDDKKLAAIVSRVKAVGHGAPLGRWCSGGPVLETLGQYGSDADAQPP